MKNYKNLPIVEAIFTVYFRELISDDLIEKFRSCEYIKNTYPQDNQGISVEINVNSSMETKKIVKKDGYLFNSGKKKLINLKYSHLSFHSIDIYDGWEKEIPYLIKALENIVLLDNSIYINKISCRFLNMINLPEDSKYDLAKYLVVYPEMPKLINSKGPFLLNFSTKDDKNDINGTVNEKLELINDKNRVIVDISVEKNVDNSDIINMFEMLREYKNLLFQNLLRLETKILFDI
ncbi:MAG: TIGR04255 family protein [Bacteroidetes bacterium]|nr:MAG: TIGR04255 family protein [Bacteroidota bacterium]